MKRVALLCLVSIGILTARARPAAAHGAEMFLGSTASGGGALALSYEFTDTVFVTPDVSLGGMTLYSSLFPGIEWLQSDQAPLYALPPGTPFSLQIMSLDPGAEVKVGSTTLTTAGQSAFVANTTNVPGDHFHPQWELLLPTGVTGNYSVSFRLTTTSPSYTSSATYTLVISNLAAPTDTPTPTQTAIATATPTTAATTTPTSTPAQGACPPVALPGCRTASKSTLVIRDGGGSAVLRWRGTWGTVAARDDFGNPQLSATYLLCVYAGTEKALIDAGGAPVPADGTKWRATGKGWRYKDPQGTAAGVTKIALTLARPNGSKASLSGSGSALPVPPLPIAAPYFPLTMQLSNSDTTPICWESVFAVSSVTQNSSGRLKATIK